VFGNSCQSELLRGVAIKVIRTLRRRCGGGHTAHVKKKTARAIVGIRVARLSRGANVWSNCMQELCACVKSVAVMLGAV
jgi:hypothetical protein